MLLDKILLAEVKARIEVIPATGEIAEWGIIALKSILGAH